MPRQTRKLYQPNIQGNNLQTTRRLRPPEGRNIQRGLNQTQRNVLRPTSSMDSQQSLDQTQRNILRPPQQSLEQTQRNILRPPSSINKQQNLNQTQRNVLTPPGVNKTNKGFSTVRRGVLKPPGNIAPPKVNSEGYKQKREKKDPRTDKMLKMFQKNVKTGKIQMLDEKK